MDDKFSNNSTPIPSKPGEQPFVDWVIKCPEDDTKWFYKVGFKYEKSYWPGKKTPEDLILKRQRELTELKDVDAEKLLQSINLAALRIRVAFKNDKKNRKSLFERLCNPRRRFSENH